MPYLDYTVIKQTLGIERVLAAEGLLEGMRRSGNELSGPCPLHGGHNLTAFRVNLTRNVFHCFACAAKGSAIDLLAELHQVPFHAAAVMAQERFLGGPTQPALPPRRARAPRSRAPERPNEPLGFRLPLDPRHPYLEERRLLPETVKHFGLGYCRQGLQAGRIAVPIHDRQGRLVAYAGRWPGEPPEGEPRYRFPPKKLFRSGLEVFHLHRALEHAGPLVLVEGFFDVFAVHQAGIPSVVSCMGTEVTEAQLRALVATGRKIVVFFDPDEAGQGRGEELAQRLWQQRVVVERVTGHTGDPGDLDAEEIRKRLGRAASQGLSRQ